MRWDDNDTKFMHTATGRMVLGMSIGGLVVGFLSLLAIIAFGDDTAKNIAGGIFGGIGLLTTFVLFGLWLMKQ
jgi:hypothetical protein